MASVPRTTGVWPPAATVSLPAIAIPPTTATTIAMAAATIASRLRVDRGGGRKPPPREGRGSGEQAPAGGVDRRVALVRTFAWMRIRLPTMRRRREPPRQVILTPGLR